MTGFDDAWYADIIERFSPDTPSPGHDGIGRSLLVAACIIGQAIDDLTTKTQEGLTFIGQAIGTPK